AEHQRCMTGCTCGWSYTSGMQGRLNAHWYAHLEAVVLAWVGARLAGAREGVARTIHEAEVVAGRAEDRTWVEGDELAEWYIDNADAALQAVVSALGTHGHADEGLRPREGRFCAPEGHAWERRSSFGDPYLKCSR